MILTAFQGGEMAHILIVEDDGSIRKGVRRYTHAILGSRATVAEAGSIEGAKNSFVECQPDLIIMDGQLPLYANRDSPTISTTWVLELRQLGYQGHIVAFSGSPKIQKMLVEAGCDLELQKEDFLTLAVKLEDIFERAGLL